MNAVHWGLLGVIVVLIGILAGQIARLHYWKETAMEEQIDELFVRIKERAVELGPKHLAEMGNFMNTAGFALAFMNPVPESLDEIIFNLQALCKRLAGVEDA